MNIARLQFLPNCRVQVLLRSGEADFIRLHHEATAQSFSLVSQQATTHQDETVYHLRYQSADDDFIEIELHHAAARDFLFWEVKTSSLARGEVKHYSPAALETDDISGYLSPSEYTIDGHRWLDFNPIEDEIKIELSDYRLGNNIVFLRTSQHVKAIGSLDLPPFGFQRVSTQGAAIDIQHQHHAAAHFNRGFYAVGEALENISRHYLHHQKKLGLIRDKEFLDWWKAPQWCSWCPYRFDIFEEILKRDIAQIIASGLPIKTIVIDDGFQKAYGDYRADETKFPNGLRPIVEQIHAAGMKAILWVAPHCLSTQAATLETHRASLVKNRDGSLYKREVVGDWHYFDITRQDTREHVRAMFRTFIEDWGFDGFKVDYFYLSPVGDYLTQQPIEANDYQYEWMKFCFETIKDLRADALVSGCHSSSIMNNWMDDTRTGDTFGGCTAENLRVSQAKMRFLMTQSHGVLRINDYIGSYDLPMNRDVFSQWVRWSCSVPQSVPAFSWMPWMSGAETIDLEECRAIMKSS